VTLVKVIDPAQPDSSLSAPDAGQRLVAAQLKFERLSGGAMQGSLLDAVTVRDTQGQSYSVALGHASAGCQMFDGDQVSLAGNGDSQLGCLTFQVPTGQNVASVRLDDGSGEVMVWTLA
jgi:hypothetical protein